MLKEKENNYNTSASKMRCRSSHPLTKDRTTNEGPQESSNKEIPTLCHLQDRLSLHSSNGECASTQLASVLPKNAPD